MTGFFLVYFFYRYPSSLAHSHLHSKRFYIKFDGHQLFCLRCAQWERCV